MRIDEAKKYALTIIKQRLGFFDGGSQGDIDKVFNLNIYMESVVEELNTVYDIKLTEENAYTFYFLVVDMVVFRYDHASENLGYPPNIMFRIRNMFVGEGDEL